MPAGLKNTDEPEIGRDGKWAVDIYDPDATRVEFMEFAPAQSPCCNHTQHRTRSREITSNANVSALQPHSDWYEQMTKSRPI
jgi:hypothetical protein